MRIIDADKFKKQIAGMAIVNGYSAQKVNKMCELIDEQPTAYDVDEVIKKLKKLRDCKYLTGITNNAYEFGACDALNDAIKIIKAGGKNDNNL